jgi:hypothetical protein
VKLPSRAAAPLLHPCREPGCTEEGSFGEGVDLLKGQLGTGAVTGMSGSIG